MILRFPNNVLHKIATKILLVYMDPIALCAVFPSSTSQNTHESTKQGSLRLVKSKILDFWETKLHTEAATKSSLIYFKPEFMLLSHPHHPATL